MTTTRKRAGRTVGTICAALLTIGTAACSGEVGGGEAEEAVEAIPSAAEDASAAAESAVEDLPAEIDCSGTSCSVVLRAGQEADVLGTDVGFASSADGTATVRVGGDEATCRQGETVEAGPLTLECTEVTEDRVELTAALG